jgi:ubiquinone/menaquinone biosynthesis C-methylase UbiE
MQAFSALKRLFYRPVQANLNTTEPEPAYDLWSSQYDHQEGNLMLALDEKLFGEMISGIFLKGLRIVDVGCGTGRQWQALLDRSPASLIGYDVSKGMLAQLRRKFPDARTYQLMDQRLVLEENESADLIISTLALAHMDRLETLFGEWSRVLKPGGEIVLTDYHPAALEKGGDRTFQHQHKLMAVRSNIHPIALTRQITARLGFTELRFVEWAINDSMKSYYEKNNALVVFEKFRGTPIIYGIHLKKSHAAT